MKVSIFTDGAARGNPDGPGGYGTVLRYIDPKGQVHEREFSQGYKKTTNNRMELMAVIQALSALKKECNISLYTDSKYVMCGVTEWMDNWKQNGWHTANKKKEVKNIDLWQKLDELVRKHEIRWIWVKGHNGHQENERCDELARSEVARIKEQNSDA